MPDLPVQSLPFTGDGLIIGGGVVYFGCNIVETGASTATVNVYNGTSTGGLLIDLYAFAAGESTHQAPYNRGVLCESGLYIDEATGAISGVVYYIPRTIWDAMALLQLSGSQVDVSRYNTLPDIYRAFNESEP